MIKHPGRWIVLIIAAFALAAWWVERTFDPATIRHLVWVLVIGGYVVSLFTTERLRGARPGALSVVMCVVAAAAYAWITGLHLGWWRTAGLMLVAAMPLMAIANATFRADVLRAQRARDARATSLTRAVLSREPVEPYALYLRPFVSTDRLMADTLPSDINPSEVPVYLDVETLLARSLRATFPLVTLGRSGEMMEGAARVTVAEDQWRETVEALAHRAAFIVMMPLSRPGTLWELEWLARNGLIGKVLLIMPEVPHQAPNGVFVPKTPDDRLFDAGVRRFEAGAHMLDLPREWLAVEHAARDLGLELPPLAGVGALFTLDPVSGATKDIVPLAMSSVMQRLRYLRMSATRLGFLTSSQPLPDFDDALAKAVLFGGRTLEYVLIRAADGFAVWGDAERAIRLTHRAMEAGLPRAAFARGYLGSLPELIEERAQFGDVRAATRYLVYARHLREDARLGPLAAAIAGKLDALSAKLGASRA